MGGVGDLIPFSDTAKLTGVDSKLRSSFLRRLAFYFLAADSLERAKHVKGKTVKELLVFCCCSALKILLMYSLNTRGVSSLTMWLRSGTCYHLTNASSGITRCKIDRCQTC